MKDMNKENIISGLKNKYSTMDKSKAEKVNAELVKMEANRIKMNKAFSNLKTQIKKGDEEAKEFNSAYQIVHANIQVLIGIFKDEIN